MGSSEGLSDVCSERLVTQDRACLLYAHGRAGLAMTAAASLLLVLMVEQPANRSGLLLWLGGMAVVLIPRGLDVMLWHRRRIRGAWDGSREIRRYGIGVSAVSLLWMLFPLLFFSTFTMNGKVEAAVVFSAMAGGSAAVLGASPTIAIGYCLMLLVPFSVLFLAQPGREAHFLGSLGVLSFVAMVATCRVNHRGVLKAIRLARQNQVLIERAQAGNAMLVAAKSALREANASLESRIKERTADLQREISERRGYASALARLASSDALTGLCNRATLIDRLQQVLRHAGEHGSTIAVLFLDLDRFKQINDVQGHCIGDQVLCAAAERLAQVCLPGADVARWGGDEFVVVATTDSPDAEAALALGRAMLTSLSQPIEAGPLTLRVGVTIGVALYPAHGATQDELIRAADVAMYAAKREGGDRVRLFDHSLACLVTDRHELDQGLRHAIADQALSVQYQPIVDAGTGCCEILEALLRWTHPERGPISPEIFIPVAEQSGQIGVIGRFVLNEACGAAMSWPAPRPGIDPPAVSVNVSVAQVLSGQLIEDVQAALERSGLPPRRLHLEITESMFAADHMRVLPVLETLHRSGIRLALDDFGIGFSSLAQLKNLPIDTIKIDKQFVQDTSEAGLAIIKAVLLIAKAMRLDVTAEGVETELQAAMLRKLGITRLQGFLLSRPMQAGRVSSWLRSESRPETARRDPAWPHDVRLARIAAER